MRLESKATSTREAGKVPYRFVQNGERVKYFEVYRKNIMVVILELNKL